MALDLNNNFHVEYSNIQAGSRGRDEFVLRRLREESLNRLAYVPRTVDEYATIANARSLEVEDAIYPGASQMTMRQWAIHHGLNLRTVVAFSKTPDLCLIRGSRLVYSDVCVTRNISNERWKKKAHYEAELGLIRELIEPDFSAEFHAFCVLPRCSIGKIKRELVGIGFEDPELETMSSKIQAILRKYERYYKELNVILLNKMAPSMNLTDVPQEFRASYDIPKTPGEWGEPNKQMSITIASLATEAYERLPTFRTVTAGRVAGNLMTIFKTMPGGEWSTECCKAVAGARKSLDPTDPSSLLRLMLDLRDLSECEHDCFGYLTKLLITELGDSMGLSPEDAMAIGARVKGSLLAIDTCQTMEDQGLYDELPLPGIDFSSFKFRVENSGERFNIRREFFARNIRKEREEEKKLKPGYVSVEERKAAGKVRTRPKAGSPEGEISLADIYKG